ncbi:MAG: TetR family transcriptional regulator C-terminal domain-containing protein [Caulobacteraceae bacterium]
MAAALARSNLGEALNQFFESDLDVFLGGGPRGCFMLSTALLVAATHPDIAERVSGAMKGLKHAITARIDHAVASGDIPASSDVEGLSDIVVAVHVALAMRARAGEPREALRRSLRRTVVLVAGGRATVPAAKSRNRSQTVTGSF